jgi:hypothetical protein
MRVSSAECGANYVELDAIYTQVGLLSFRIDNLRSAGEVVAAAQADGLRFHVGSSLGGSGIMRLGMLGCSLISWVGLTADSKAGPIRPQADRKNHNELQKLQRLAAGEVGPVKRRRQTQRVSRRGVKRARVEKDAAADEDGKHGDNDEDDHEDGDGSGDDPSDGGSDGSDGSSGFDDDDAVGDVMAGGGGMRLQRFLRSCGTQCLVLFARQL